MSLRKHNKLRVPEILGLENRSDSDYLKCFINKKYYWFPSKFENNYEADCDYLKKKYMI